MSEMIYKRATNQETFKINREKVEQPFLYVKWESVNVAKANLGPVAFILWLYLARHKDGTKWVFSMKSFCEWAGVSYSTGARAKKELLSKDTGYLVPIEGKKSEFNFYEYPEQLRTIAQEENIIQIHKTSGDSPEADGFTF